MKKMMKSAIYHKAKISYSAIPQTMSLALFAPMSAPTDEWPLETFVLLKILGQLLLLDGNEPL